MRKIRIYRHSLRDGHFISPEGIELVMAVASELKKERLNVSKIFYSSYTRSLHTAVYLTIGLDQPEIVAQQIPELSGKKSDQIFFSNDAFMEEYRSNTEEDLMLIVKRHLSLEQVLNIEMEAARAVRKCFDNLCHGQTAIAIGHTPYISMAADHLSIHDPGIRVEGRKFENGRFCGLKEMEYIDFIID